MNEGETAVTPALPTATAALKRRRPPLAPADVVAAAPALLDVQVRGLKRARGNEGAVLHSLLRTYEVWGRGVHPELDFDHLVLRLERMGGRRDIADLLARCRTTEPLHTILASLKQQAANDGEGSQEKEPIQQEVAEAESGRDAGESAEKDEELSPEVLARIAANKQRALQQRQNREREEMERRERESQDVAEWEQLFMQQEAEERDEDERIIAMASAMEAGHQIRNTRLQTFSTVRVNETPNSTVAVASISNSVTEASNGEMESTMNLMQERVTPNSTLKIAETSSSDVAARPNGGVEASKMTDSATEVTETSSSAIPDSNKMIEKCSGTISQYSAGETYIGVMARDIPVEVNEGIQKL